MGLGTEIAQTERQAIAGHRGGGPMPSRRRRVWRLAWRTAGAVGAGVLLAGAVCLYGWRFGFTPLPEPVPEGAWTPLRAAQPAELTRSDYWYWVDAFNRASVVNRRSDIIHGWTLFDWAQTGHLTETNRAGLAAFFGGNAALEASFRGALAAGKTHTNLWERRRVGRDLVGHTRLVNHAAWKALEEEQAGRTVAALERLLEGWQLCANSGAAGLTRPELGTLAGAWRRLALEGPGLDRSEGLQLIEGLAEVREALPRLDVEFLRAVHSRQEVLGRAASEGLLPRAAGRRFWAAFSRMTGETLEILGNLASRIMGGSRTIPANDGRGIRHLAEPCGELLRHMQTRVGRPADLDQVRDAYVSRVLAALRRGADDEAQERAAALQSTFASRSFPSRFFDRPAAWRSIAEFPPVRPLVEEARAARTTLESCRLVLALRLYRDRHGEWPERLDALVPEWLPGVPQDPFTGESFAYQREGNGWLVRAVHPDARAPDPADEGILFHSAEPAEARLLRLITGQGTRITGIMDVQMLQRYGLVPKGLSGFLSQVRTNQPLAQALSAVIPAVSDLRALIRLQETRGAPR